MVISGNDRQPAERDLPAIVERARALRAETLARQGRLALQALRQLLARRPRSRTAIVAR
ncbi:hypothetical protein [Albidovulum sp.]